MIFTQVQHPSSATSLLVFSSHDAAEDAYQMLAKVFPVVYPYTCFQAFALVCYDEYFNAVEFISAGAI